MSKLLRRVAIPGAAAAMIATSGFAFMATNSVPDSYAGTGDGTISGYQVSNIHYGTAAKWPGGAYLKSVSFDLNHAATADNVGAYVFVNYKGQPSRWTDCQATNTSNTSFKCTQTGGDTTGAVLVKDLVKITVSAAQ